MKLQSLLNAVPALIVGCIAYANPSGSPNSPIWMSTPSQRARACNSAFDGATGISPEDELRRRRNLQGAQVAQSLMEDGLREKLSLYLEGIEGSDPVKTLVALSQKNQLSRADGRKLLEFINLMNDIKNLDAKLYARTLTEHPYLQSVFGPPPQVRELNFDIDFSGPGIELFDAKRSMGRIRLPFETQRAFGAKLWDWKVVSVPSDEVTGLKIFNEYDIDGVTTEMCLLRRLITYLNDRDNKKERPPVYVISLDPLYLNNINSVLSFDEGNGYLKAIARVLRASVFEKDYVLRGDPGSAEIIIIARAKDEEGAMLLGAKIRNNLINDPEIIRIMNKTRDADKQTYTREYMLKPRFAIGGTRLLADDDEKTVVERARQNRLAQKQVYYNSLSQFEREPQKLPPIFLRLQPDVTF
jgi:GGDEF domain-containing protein